MNIWLRNTVIILFTLAVLVVISILSPKEANWRESYSRLDKIPYGCLVLYERIHDLFPSAELQLGSRTVYEESVLRENDIDLFLFVNQSFLPDEIDRNVLLEEVGQGASAFIAASDIDRVLLDTLGLKLRYTYPPPSFFGDDTSQTVMDSSRIEAKPGYKAISSIYPTGNNDIYYIKSDYSSTYFKESGESLGQIDTLGMTSRDSLPNFVRIPYGEGYFYLNSFPRAFTNYHVLKPDTRRYSSRVLSHIPEDIEVIYWDAYYKVGKIEDSRSSLRVILSDPGTRTAWYILLGGLVVYLLFFMKREQRIIPVVKPLENSTVAYTRTLGSMYFEEGRPVDILNKRVDYFRDYLARKFYIRDVRFTETQAEELSARTAFSEESSKKLYRILRNLEKRDEITSGQLIAATQRLNEFYRNT